MARPAVIDSSDGTRVPFLRGILTRSLRNCGLSFDEAYSIATKVRGELAGQGEIASADLRAYVVPHLKPFGEEAVERYRRPRRETARIVIRAPDGHDAPFSRGAHRPILECCGLSPDQAADIAAKIHDGLIRDRVEELDELELRRRTHRQLANDVSKGAGKCYLVWEEFRESGRPLVLLIGGAPGTGKSSISTRLANMLDISRTQPTDMLREVMRMMVPERLLPTLHRSSFLAGTALPGGALHHDVEASTVEGYLAQAELVGVACQAALTRVLDERLSLILEGVHVHPEMLSQVPEGSDAIVVPIMFAVLKPKLLRKRIRGRGREAPERRAKRFLKNFDAIWSLQTWLLAEADRTGVPIVENEDRDQTVQDAVGCILQSLAEVFPGKLDTGKS